MTFDEEIRKKYILRNTFEQSAHFFTKLKSDCDQGGLPEAEGTVVADHSLGDAAP